MEGLVATGVARPTVFGLGCIVALVLVVLILEGRELRAPPGAGSSRTWGNHRGEELDDTLLELRPREPHAGGAAPFCSAPLEEEAAPLGRSAPHGGAAPGVDR